MQFTLIQLLSMAAVVSMVEAQTQTGSTTVDGRKVDVAWTGPVAAQTSGNSGSASLSGSGTANVEGFGKINVIGSGMGSGKVEGDVVSGQAAVNGYVNGPNGLYAGGAAMGAGSVNTKTGDGTVTGAINGGAAYNGQGVRGAAQGTVSGNVYNQQLYQASGVYNGCYTGPNGQQICAAAGPATGGSGTTTGGTTAGKSVDTKTGTNSNNGASMAGVTAAGLSLAAIASALMF